MSLPQCEDVLKEPFTKQSRVMSVTNLTNILPAAFSMISLQIKTVSTEKLKKPFCWKKL